MSTRCPIKVLSCSESVIESQNLLRSGNKDDTRPGGTDLFTCNSTAAVLIFCTRLRSSFLSSLVFFFFTGTEGAGMEGPGPEGDLMTEEPMEG